MQRESLLLISKNIVFISVVIFLIVSLYYYVNVSKYIVRDKYAGTTHYDLFAIQFVVPFMFVIIILYIYLVFGSFKSFLQADRYYLIFTIFLLPFFILYSSLYYSVNKYYNSFVNSELAVIQEKKIGERTTHGWTRGGGKSTDRSYIINYAFVSDESSTLHTFLPGSDMYSYYSIGDTIIIEHYKSIFFDYDEVKPKHINLE